MKRNSVNFLAMLGILLISFQSFAVDSTKLVPKPIYGKEANAVVYLLDNSHYSKIQFNDSLSSRALDEFLLALDPGKNYFFASDVLALEVFRYKLDDLIRDEDVSFPYQVFEIFKKRFDERIDYVLNSLIDHDFDFSIEEFYQVNREKVPWIETKTELEEEWRKVIKSQVLSLKLTGKEPAEIKKTMRERYERLKKSMDQLNSEDVFSMYMNTITESYDPHTNYFSPKATDLFKQSMSLSLEGIGARLQTDNDYTKIVEVLPGGPAEKSDLIHANDRIIGVGQGEDGEIVDVLGWRIDEVVKLIKGPKGTKVRLQFLPAESGIKGPSKEIILVRDKIKLEDQKASKDIIEYNHDGKNLKLGVITLPSFYMDFDAYQNGDPNYTSTTRDVKMLLEELKEESINGMVLDLRNNGGGSLAEAIDLTGLFIKDGPVVQVKNSANQVQEGRDDDPSIMYDGPLVVLTNRFSASASEIFAGAVQDYSRGVVVGESTHGKGTVQTIVDLSKYIKHQDEKVGHLKLTFQKFYRVTGSSTQKKGVTPDIELPTPYVAEEWGESSYPNAMPWDEIKGTLYSRTPLINSRVIAGLTEAYEQRLVSDPSLNRLVIETNEFKKSLEETKISLHEQTRKKEMDEAEEKNVGNDKLGVKLEGEDKQKLEDLAELEDEYLREGLLVLTDLINSKWG